METNRELFEQGVLARNQDYDHPPVLLERNASGNYSTVRIQGEWIGWQAAITLLNDQKPTAWACHDLMLTDATPTVVFTRERADMYAKDIDAATGKPTWRVEAVYSAPVDQAARIARLELALCSVLNQPETPAAYDAMMQRVADALADAPDQSTKIGVAQ